MSIISYIRTIPDYPPKGVQFRDITTLFLDSRGLREAVDELVMRYSGAKIEKIAVIEARGFLVGAPLAYALGCGLVPIRKKANCRVKPSDRIIRWNMAQTGSRYTMTPFSPDRKSC